MTFQSRPDPAKPRQTPEDWARAFGYLLGCVWAVIFIVYTPTAFDSGLPPVLIYLWMAVTLVGGTLALSGVFLGIDIKLELPGIVVLAIGPVLYFALQAVLVGNGQPQREALTVFALWHVALFLPRFVGLISEARKEKRAALAREAEL